MDGGEPENDKVGDGVPGFSVRRKVGGKVGESVRVAAGAEVGMASHDPQSRPEVPGKAKK